MTGMPAEVRAAVLAGVRDVRVRSFPMPSVGNDDAVGACALQETQRDERTRDDHVGARGLETRNSASLLQRHSGEASENPFLTPLG